ncbi:MAG: ATP-grasp domain-containing protein [Planctomycetaceae bacterium]|nr:MAG: ATP-grasp domain-containing protein [Planctomycetaceae bacterium]
MAVLIVVDNPAKWPFAITGVDVVEARSYLTRPDYSEMRGVKLINLCRSYSYQTSGYYVSLLAEARGHKPLPSVTTIQDMKSQAFVRLVSDDLDDLIQRSLAPIQSEKFTLSIYFGRNMARRYDRLSLRLFNLFQAPLIRVQFARNGKWTIRSVAAIATNEVPESHAGFLVDAATEHFAGRGRRSPRRVRARYDIAILHNPQESNPPSDDKALRKFERAGAALGLSCERITRDDYARLAEFDALFIRETTYVNHHTYRFARRAASEGLVVIDDPDSIVRCTNKVFLAELLRRHRLPMPQTMVVHKGNMDGVASAMGMPCILKQPDSAFSIGVVKVDTEQQLNDELKRLLTDSELVIAQSFLPTTFDWRIGILNRRPLYACKYFMAPRHWQIMKHEGQKTRYGKWETLPVELAPRSAVRAALKAANLIGDGLYGVDVKESNGEFYIIEINDNPNIEARVEDAILRDELYTRIMSVLLNRIEHRKSGYQPA